MNLSIETSFAYARLIPAPYRTPPTVLPPEILDCHFIVTLLLWSRGLHTPPENLPVDPTISRKKAQFSSCFLWRSLELVDASLLTVTRSQHLTQKNQKNLHVFSIAKP
jgi:hypothetical protein